LHTSQALVHGDTLAWTELCIPENLLHSIFACYHIIEQLTSILQLRSFYLVQLNMLVVQDSSDHVAQAEAYQQVKQCGYKAVD
jgi:hypothetical protein